MISLIAAISHNNQIGLNNKMPWHIKEDLLYFKTITSGHTVIMGRKTFESIGKPLPHRKNIILTKNHSLTIPNVRIICSVSEILDLISREKEEVFIIGGGEIYNLFLPYADKLYLTLLDLDIEGDTDFPDYSNDFKQISSHLGTQVDEVGFNYYFTEWIRK